ncbi:unnamed protein product, partial [Polarella glacialis]
MEPGTFLSCPLGSRRALSQASWERRSRGWEPQAVITAAWSCTDAQPATSSTAPLPPLRPPKLSSQLLCVMSVAARCGLGREWSECGRAARHKACGSSAGRRRPGDSSLILFKQAFSLKPSGFARFAAIQELMEIFEGSSSTLLETMGDRGMWREALDLLAEELELGKSMEQKQKDNNNKNNSNNKQTELYSSAIWVMVKSRQWERALGLFGSWRSSKAGKYLGSSAGLCGGALAALEVGQCWQQALSFFDELREFPDMLRDNCCADVL